MAIKIYCEYEEFIYCEKELADYFEDQAITDNTFSDDDYLDNESEDIMGTKEIEGIREDANFYIICDVENEEVAEDIASNLGRYTKINLKEFDKTFFYLV
jgi:hypothetical protein